MSAHRLRSSLHHSVPKPASEPPPLWQVAAALDPEETAAAPDTRTPATSAVLAGWICVGIGLLTAWLFPLAHVFFSIAIVLSVVAMATHQVRSGFLLLAGSLAGIVGCALVFLCGVAAVVAGAFHAARQPAELTATSPISTVHQTVVRGPVAQKGIVGGNPTTYANRQAFTLDEVMAMLTNGKQDEQIIAAIIGRPMLGQIGAAETTGLRVYGAGEHLINYLRARSPAESSSAATVATAARTFAPALPAPESVSRAAATPAATDYAARDRQIQSLKTQVDDLSEQVRRIRENPRDYRYYWRYASSQYNGVDQAKLDVYLKELDRQRDDLRRQKWALEGR